MKSIAFALCALMVLAWVSGCNTMQPAAAVAGSPAVTQAPLPEAATPAPASAPQETEPTPEPLEIWKQNEEYDWYTSWALLGAEGISRETTPAAVPDSVMAMLPLIETMLCYRGSYDGRHDDLRLFDGVFDDDMNEHLIGNDAYLWGMLAEVLLVHGENHPDATRNEHGVITVPKHAARDFMEVCFAAYTPEFEMPQSPPGRWVENPLSTWVQDGEILVDEIMRYENGSYLCAKSGVAYSGSRQWFVVIHARENGEDGYKLTLIKIEGPDDHDLKLYRVLLSAADEANALGLAWRVNKIILVDTTHGWDPCDFGEH